MPTNRNLNQRIKAALYELKKQYGGGPVRVYTNLVQTVDLSTGEKTESVNVTQIRRVIILPVKMTRDVVQSISQISANKQFVMGGFYDAATRMFIIDRRDIPGLEIKQDDFLVFDDRRYEIKDIQAFEFDTGYVIIARHQVGEVFEQSFPGVAVSPLELSSTCTGTL